MADDIDGMRAELGMPTERGEDPPDPWDED